MGLPQQDYDCPLHGKVIPDTTMRRAITDLRDSKVPDSHPYKKRHLNG